MPTLTLMLADDPPSIDTRWMVSVRCSPVFTERLTLTTVTRPVRALIIAGVVGAAKSARDDVVADERVAFAGTFAADGATDGRLGHAAGVASVAAGTGGDSVPVAPAATVTVRPTADAAHLQHHFAASTKNRRR